MLTLPFDNFANWTHSRRGTRVQRPYGFRLHRGGGSLAARKESESRFALSLGAFGRHFSRRPGEGPCSSEDYSPEQAPALRHEQTVVPILILIDRAAMPRHRLPLPSSSHLAL
jgi:hypothetical protein